MNILQNGVTSPHLSIVIPAYNEEARISDTLLAISDYLSTKDYSYELLVVDDGSTDDTANLCSKFSARHPWVRCLQSSRNHGKGYAVREGVLNSTGEYVLMCDADLATPIEELDGFWQLAEDAVDIVIASRPLRQSHLVKRQPLYRELAGRSFNLVVQLLAVPGIQDTQCGFKLFNRRAAQKIFPCCTLDGFGFDIEVLYLANRLGFSVKESPVHWYHRDGSKVRLLRDGFNMLADLVRIRLRHRSLSAKSNCSD